MTATNIFFLIINCILLIKLVESVKAQDAYSINKYKQIQINEMNRKIRISRKGKKENKIMEIKRIISNNRRKIKNEFMRKNYYSLSEIHEDIKKYKYSLYFLLAIEILIFSFSENPSIALIRIFIVILIPFIIANYKKPFFQI